MGNLVPKQALYQLLGQNLDICVEAHADAYQQARKKWSECSMEEWTKGADGTYMPPFARCSFPNASSCRPLGQVLQIT